MFDFRYHALSLVAVFLALGIGIVLGASLGDTVVSQANKDVRSSLRGDLLDARSSAAKEKVAVSQRDRFIDAAFARLVDSKLRGKHIAIVSNGPLTPSVENDVRGAVKAASGAVDTVSRFDAQPDLPSIVPKLGARYQALGLAPDAVRTIGLRVGKSLATGGRLARELQNAFPDQFAGTFAPADAVVYYRTDDTRDDRAKTFESGLLAGLRSAGVPLVAVEESDTNPSQISFYVKSSVASVDNVDTPAGRIALVLSLLGQTGNWGEKKTADAPLPPPRGAAPAGSGG